MISTFYFSVAFPDCIVNVFSGFSVDISGELVGFVAGGASESGLFSFVGLEGVFMHMRILYVILLSVSTLLCPCAGLANTFILDNKSIQNNQVKTNASSRSAFY